VSNIQKYSDKTFEDIKHINEYGIECWFARELAPVLEYARWEKIKGQKCYKVKKQNGYTDKNSVVKQSFDNLVMWKFSK